VANKNKKMFLFVYLFGHQVTKKILKIFKKNDIKDHNILNYINLLQFFTELYIYIIELKNYKEAKGILVVLFNTIEKNILLHGGPKLPTL